MKKNYILSLETTEQHGSVAMLDGQRLLYESVLPHDQRSAQTLADSIDHAFGVTGIVPREVRTLAVVVGPGSFTGLRVGVATAKMFAYAIEADIVALRTHDVVAEIWNMQPNSMAPDFLSIGVDAQRGEVVVQTFERSEAGKFVPIDSPNLVSVQDWWALAEKRKNTLFTGPALARWHTTAPKTVTLADSAKWFPNATLAGFLAAEKHTRGEIEDIWSLVPIYSRPSAAEERAGDS